MVVQAPQLARSQDSLGPVTSSRCRKVSRSVLRWLDRDLLTWPWTWRLISPCRKEPSALSSAALASSSAGSGVAVSTAVAAAMLDPREVRGCARWPTLCVGIVFSHSRDSPPLFLDVPPRHLPEGHAERKTMQAESIDAAPSQTKGPGVPVASWADNMLRRRRLSYAVIDPPTSPCLAS